MVSVAILYVYWGIINPNETLDKMSYVSVVCSMQALLVASKQKMQCLLSSHRYDLHE